MTEMTGRISDIHIDRMESYGGAVTRSFARVEIALDDPNATLRINDPVTIYQEDNR